MSIIARFCKAVPIFMGAVFYLTYCAHAASMRSLQQQPPEPQSAAPSNQPHKVKVWTNDDIVTLRTPADLYILEKEAEAAAEDAKALMSCFAPAPADAEVEDTQKQIDAASQSISDAEAAVNQAKKDLEAAPESLKARNRTELEHRTLEVEAYRDQLKLLLQRLQRLNEQQSAVPQPASSAPQPAAIPQPPAAPSPHPETPSTQSHD